MRSNKPYKHIGKRLVNIPSGSIGRITSAVPVGKTSWNITVKWENGGQMDWGPSELFKMNLMVPEDYKHPDTNPRERALKLLAGEPLHGRIGYYVGRGLKISCHLPIVNAEDTLTFHATWPSTLSMHLWGVPGGSIGCCSDQIEGWDSNGDRYQQLAAALRKKIDEKWPN